MNKNWVKVIAAVLFLGSFTTFVYSLATQDPLAAIAGLEWTVLDYASLVMFIAALGCSLAAYKLPDEDEDVDS